jgi:hypothetical protein
MLQTLQSIEQVEKVYDTGCKPILVHCSDLEYYVCKYNTTTGAANLLFREYMAASFLRIWNLQVPIYALVNLQNHHNPESKKNINNAMPCFGSLFNNELREIDAFIVEASYSQKLKFINKNQLLNIALFDYWSSNDDRNFNNYNIMLKMENDQYNLVPIDGGAVFHTGNQDKKNYTLSIDESLISSPFAESLINTKGYFTEALINALKENYYFCIKSCRVSLQELIDNVPYQWQINKQTEYNNLKNFLFKDNWIEECWDIFNEHLGITFNL